MAGDPREDARGRLRAALLAHGALWAVLVGLVGLSLGLSFVHLGSLNLLVAIAIATVQVGLLAFFMTLRRASALILVTAGIGFVFLLAMVVLTFNDLFSRI